MRLEQVDVARLSDVAIKGLVVMLGEVSGDMPEPMRAFWRSLQRELVRLVRERRSVVADLALDFDSGDAETGGLVSDGDPVGDAVDELRRAVREQGRGEDLEE